jgi:hypothetical protein
MFYQIAIEVNEEAVHMKGTGFMSRYQIKGYRYGTIVEAPRACRHLSMT